MNASLMNRVRKLEARTPAPVLVRVLSFTGQIGDVARIEGPGGPWHRMPDESTEELRRRAAAAAMDVAAGMPILALREINLDGADGRNWGR